MGDPVDHRFGNGHTARCWVPIPGALAGRDADQAGFFSGLVEGGAFDLPTIMPMHR